MKSGSAFDPDALRTRGTENSSRHANADASPIIAGFNLPVPVKFFFTGKASGGNFSGSREETEKPFAVGPWVDVLDIPPFASGGTR